MRPSTSLASQEEEDASRGSSNPVSANEPPRSQSSQKNTSHSLPKPVQHEFQMDDSAASLAVPDAHARTMDGGVSGGGSNIIGSVMSRAGSSTGSALLRKQMFAGMARHTLGLILLLVVVFLWTLSNFLGSSIFADSSYAKPFFLTYLNTSIFVFAMVPSSARWIIRQWKMGTLRTETSRIFSFQTLKALFGRGSGSGNGSGSGSGNGSGSGSGNGSGKGNGSGSGSGMGLNHNDDDDNDDGNDETEAFIKPHGRALGSSDLSAGSMSIRANSVGDDDSSLYLGLVPTARLAFAFCILWFGANYFAMACLQHATVASATILTSTSSIWTLLIGAVTHTEKFTWRKLCGVLASLAGIILISHVDLSSTTDEKNQKRALDVFPDKPAAELALGDGMALLSAIVYGLYTITLKKSTLKADPLELHMPTFFGLVGLFNVFLLLPLFPALHYTGIEPFEWPPTTHIWMILIVNSISSFASDISWAYAMVFTSPLLVTVGLSLTIPLSLIGEMVVQARYEGWMYWIGAMVVVGSFVFVEREEVREEEDGADAEREEYENDRFRFAEEGGLVNAHPGPSGSDRYAGGGGSGDDEDKNTDIVADSSRGAADGDDDDGDNEDDAVRDRLQRQINGITHE